MREGITRFYKPQFFSGSPELTPFDIDSVIFKSMVENEDLELIKEKLHTSKKLKLDFAMHRFASDTVFDELLKILLDNSKRRPSELHLNFSGCWAHCWPHEGDLNSSENNSGRAGGGAAADIAISDKEIIGKLNSSKNNTGRTGSGTKINITSLDEETRRRYLNSFNEEIDAQKETKRRLIHYLNMQKLAKNYIQKLEELLGSPKCPPGLNLNISFNVITFNDIVRILRATRKGNPIKLTLTSDLQTHYLALSHVLNLQSTLPSDATLYLQLTLDADNFRNMQRLPFSQTGAAIIFLSISLATTPANATLNDFTQLHDQLDEISLQGKIRRNITKREIAEAGKQEAERKAKITQEVKKLILPYLTSIFSGNIMPLSKKNITERLEKLNNNKKAIEAVTKLAGEEGHCMIHWAVNEIIDDVEWEPRNRLAP